MLLTSSGLEARGSGLIIDTEFMAVRPPPTFACEE